MAKIHVLSEETIDKIAAGEVVERPASIVKELVENAIDAGADAITIEIKEGGISFIRITDNGEGIEKSEIRNAFCRHATSKITSIEDVSRVISLGFRGEALSSIAAVAQIELITKTKEELTGIRYVIEGAVEKEMSEVGVPQGTTLIVRNIFFNTPVRRKFLKSAATEGGYIAELCEHLALSKPSVSFKFIMNGQVRFHTSGDGDLKELIYRIYGKEISKEIIPISQNSKDIEIEGYLGKPTITRSNRNFENYFVNGRYIKSSLVAKAVEEGYKSYMMQHKFPFFILNINVNTDMIDVNVHPTKMDVRFTNQEYFFDYLVSAVNTTLKVREMIPDVYLEEPKEDKKTKEKIQTPEPFEQERIAKQNIDAEEVQKEVKQIFPQTTVLEPVAEYEYRPNVIKAKEAVLVNQSVQMNLFEDKILTREARQKYRILGQIFDTYWLIEYDNKLLMMDQHAAHEKVKYEALIKKMKDCVCETQTLNPPIIISVTAKEEVLLNEYQSYFNQLGFELEEFGGSEVAIRSVPLDLYGQNEKDMFMDILAELETENPKGKTEAVLEKLASMACKAAVKGNNSMSFAEVNELLDELLCLENPYHCPHGRPTIVSMSKYEIEKKFKRIV